MRSLFVLAVLWFVGLCGCVEATSSEGRTGSSVRDASRVRLNRPSPRVRRVDAAIPVVLPVGEEYVAEILGVYHRTIGTASSRRAWLEAVDRCLVPGQDGQRDHLPVVKRAAELLGGRYSPAFITGLIVHESWCRADLVTADGGTGYAQITPDRDTGRVDARWLRAAELVLGHAPEWRTNPLDNIVLGLVQLRESEIELGSRELGIAAYNAGIGGVRNAQRQAGWKEGQPFRSLKAISQFLPHRPHRWDARRYPAKVLASGILVERVRRGLRLPLRRIPLSAIPGAIP